MLYRPFGKTGRMVSAFGMGCMRLPQITAAGGKSEVDFDEAIKMIRYAVDHGVNYFDSAFTYHGGTSEVALGQALAGGYRDKVMIATKQPIRIIENESDFRRNLETTLKRLGTDHLDVYLMHHLSNELWDKAKRMHMPEWYQKFKDEGLIKSIGFSFHGSYDVFTDILNYGDFDMCQIQQNLLDIDKQATEKAVYYASGLGKAVVIMEPLRGGGLVKAPPEVEAVYNSFPVKRRPVEWAFRHLYNYEGISCILSGVTTMEQLTDNIKIFEEAAPNCMSDAEKELIVKARDAYRARADIPCTGCSYCTPCPKGVVIPRLFDFYNSSIMMETDGPKRTYKNLMKNGESAASCVECGLCEKKCPQELEIRNLLKKVHSYFISE